MRRRAKLWSGSLLVLASLTMSRAGEPQRQELPHHPIHDHAMEHPEMAESTETRTTDFGVSTTITRSSPKLLGPVIDGAKTPNRIPDDVALRVLLETHALPAAPSAEEQARVDFKLARLGLDALDLEVLRQELRLYHTSSTERKQRIADVRRIAGGNMTPTTWGALVAEDQALSRLAVASYDRLLSSLSPDGALQLQQQVARIKTKIKISPPPNMSR